MHKMTGLTARNFGLADRGEIRTGAFADITLFNADTVADAADFRQSSLPATGIESVIINGVPVWKDGASTGARPGQVLSRPAAVGYESGSGRSDA